ncbi:MAG: TonB-dependent receptor [Betaproteobacteria bacterium]|nr:TonB-dependent receptor [Betaproteobacteria bacterium]
MKTSNKKRHQDQQPLPFVMRPLAASCLALLFATSAVYAQQAEPAKTTAEQEAAKKEADKKAAAKKEADKKAGITTLDTVQVTGIRRGIENAIAVKRDSDSIVESISAEDIGKLPDVSIAESIARLPGLAAQRVNGRAQVISVRGLSPDFSNTLLNGREQVSSGDNRAVEFDQYPSELINAVTVYKTPDAGLIGQGLSGTLDLQTVRPLSFAKRTVALNVRGERNTLGARGPESKSTGNRVSATYIDQFADRTVGLALGYAHLESPIVSDQFGTYGYNTGGRAGVPAGTFSTEGLKIVALSGENKRDGAVAIVEFKPNQSFSSVVDAYYSKFKTVLVDRRLETHIGGYNNNGTGGINPNNIPVPSLNYTNPIIQNGLLVGGSASGVYPLVRGKYVESTNKLSALGWNNKYRWNDWLFIGDLSYSEAKRNGTDLETQTQYRDAAGNPVFDTATYRLNSNGFPTITYGLNYADPARLQVGNTIYGAGYGKIFIVKDDLTSVKAAANRTLDGLFRDVEFGVNYADRTKKKRQPEAGLDTLANGFRPISGNLLSTPIGLSFAGAPSILTYDVLGVLNALYKPFTPSETAFSYLIPKSWTVDEKIATAYTKLNIDTELGPATVRGNIGLQIQNTDQSSNANVFDSSAPSGQQVRGYTDGKKYTDALPSLNLAFTFDGQQTVRLGVGRQIARARLDQMRASVEFGISDDGKPGAGGGNPKLEPFRANAYDISYEKYFQEKAYIAVAGFYKDLKTYTVNQTVENYDFTTLIAGNPKARTNFGNFSTVVNGKGGKVNGGELTVSIPFNMVVSFLDGFGVVASGSRTFSEITAPLDGRAAPLPGLSKNVTNLTLYYEKYNFSTRINQRRRSDYVGEITNFAGERNTIFIKGERVIDFQIGYDFKEGPLSGLGLLLQVNNLTNEAYSTYSNTPDRILDYQKYGRTILFGVNYKL